MRRHLYHNTIHMLCGGCVYAVGGYKALVICAAWYLLVAWYFNEVHHA